MLDCTTPPWCAAWTRSRVQAALCAAPHLCRCAPRPVPRRACFAPRTCHFRSPASTPRRRRRCTTRCAAPRGCVAPHPTGIAWGGRETRPPAAASAAAQRALGSMRGTCAAVPLNAYQLSPAPLRPQGEEVAAAWLHALQLSQVSFDRCVHAAPRRRRASMRRAACRQAHAHAHADGAALGAARRQLLDGAVPPR